MISAAAAVQAAQDDPAGTYRPLAARYQETRGDAHGHGRTHDWYFTRNGSQVELGRGGYVEMWQLDARGQVSWQRVFHEDRKLIAYTPGELRTQNRAPAWEVLNTVIDARLLDSLRRVGPARHLGQPATRYRGQVGNEKIEVVWLDAEQLPAEIVRRDKQHSYRLRLRELRPVPASNWPRADLARAAEYEHVDGADLGDREYDPFVRKVLAMDGGGAHAH